MKKINILINLYYKNSTTSFISMMNFKLLCISIETRNWFI